MNYVSELSLLKNNVAERATLNKQFKYKCNMCKCCTKDIKFEIDHIITPLSA